MATVATALGERLAAADPGHADGYRRRAGATANELTRLDRSFQDGLKNCARREIITAHAAFGYLADRYGLRQIPVSGVDPSGGPSPKRLAELTRLVSATDATTVFTETLVSRRPPRRWPARLTRGRPCSTRWRASRTARPTTT